MGIYAGPVVAGKAPVNLINAVISGTTTDHFDQALVMLTNFAANNGLEGPMLPGFNASSFTSSPTLVANWRPALLTVFQQLGGEGGTGEVEVTDIIDKVVEADVVVDPSSLLKLQDRVRVSYWREL